VDYEGLGSLAAGLEGALDQVSKLLAKPEAILLAGRLADFPPCVDFFRKAYNLTIVTCRDPAAMLRVIATQSTRVSLAASGAANISWKVGGHETVLFRQGEREACRGELALPHGENAIVVINGHNYTFSFAHVAQRMLVGYRAIVRQYQGGKESANLGIMFCSSPALDLPDLLDAVVRVGGHGHRVQIKRTFLESIFSLPSTTVALASNLSMDRKRASVAKDEREKVAQFLTNMKGRIRFDLDFEAVTTEEERRQMLHELDEYNITTDMAAEQVEAIKAQFADVLHRYDEWVGWNPALLRLKKALDEVGSSDDEAVKEVRELYEVAEASNHGTGVNISVAELDVARKRLAEAAHEA
jgi:uncharacterized protein YutD